MSIIMMLSLAVVATMSATDDDMFADEDRPNIIIVVIDDMPFLEAFAESLPEGVDLKDGLVTYEDYPTPNIDAFRNESLIFPTSFCGGPKCAPSRYSILTGRQPVRCLWAIEQTLDEGSEIYGPDLTSNNVKMAWDDGIFNIPSVLRDNGYHTGMVGKWHLMTNDDNGHRYHCETLTDTPDAELYGKCKNILMEQGFSFVDAWYYENIADNPYFSHNPEWLVSQSQKFIDRAINESAPFFLYFAATLTHTPQVEAALLNYTMYDSPKGQLSGDDVPDDTAMMSRAEIWARALEEAGRGGNVQQFAKFLWMDDMFGALMTYLADAGVYDNTFVAFVSDHGTEAKGTLYQQGSRILNFVRYPPTIGTLGPKLMPSDFMSSTVDLAATIFEVASVDPPAEYLMDGFSFLDHTSAATTLGADRYQNDTELEDDTSHQDPTTAQESHFDYKYIDVFRSHSIVSARWQYIFRATLEVEPSQGEAKYEYFDDRQQLYDLWVDPSQQNNLMRTNLSSLTESEHFDIITLFLGKMRDYIDEICFAENATECLKPGEVAPNTTTTTLPPGVECINDDQCDPREMCDDGECVPKSKLPTPCNDTSDCTNFKICNSDGECERAHLCWSDAECLEHQTCTEGECLVSPGKGCTSDADCGDAQQCIRGGGDGGGVQNECRRKGTKKGFGKSIWFTDVELFQEDGAPKPLVPLYDESLVGHVIVLATLVLLVCIGLALRRCWNTSRKGDDAARRLLLREGHSSYGAV